MESRRKMETMALLSLLLGCALFSAACGDGTLVVVELTGVTADVRTIRVRPQLNGSLAKGVEDFPPGTREFGLDFPQNARGRLKLLIGGYDASGCLVSGVIPPPEIDLLGQGRFDLRSALVRSSAPLCN